MDAPRRPTRADSKRDPQGVGSLLTGALETALWLLSLGCLSTVLWMGSDAWWFQHQAERHWRGAKTPSTVATRATPALRSKASDVPLGRLSIPRLDLSAFVAEGTSTEVLLHAVGHLTASARFGEGGNVVLAGHRDTFFRPLEGIRIGDRIDLDDGARVYHYRVVWVDVVDPDRSDLAAPGDEPVLTLITCYPFRYLGSAPRRFVVRARALPPVAASADPSGA